MRIGIVTQPLHNNYGGILQNFALQQLLRDHGYNPVTLDWCGGKAPLWKRAAHQVKQWMLWKLHRAPRPRYIPSADEMAVISQHTARFISRYITCTNRIVTSSDFLKETEREGIEAFVVGSDQVWRAKYSRGHLLDMFLAFAEGYDVKRVAYAASFGEDQWRLSSVETALCRPLAARFDLITVREESGVALCKDNLGVEATQVLDPTLLHDKTLYERIVVENQPPKSAGTLFYYMLDPSTEKTAFIQSVAQEKGWTPFTVMPLHQAENRTRAHVRREMEQCVYPSVEMWLKAFMDAEMVLCDSYHGCLFSILFNKPFWVVGNEKRGNARFTSLLKTFGLQDRLIAASDRGCVDAPIDWERVNAILAEKRRFSTKLLLDALKG